MSELSYNEYATKLRNDRQRILDFADVARQTMYEELTETYGWSSERALVRVERFPLDVLFEQHKLSALVELDVAQQVLRARKIGHQLAISYHDAEPLEKE